MKFKLINWVLLDAMREAGIKNQYTRHELGIKIMPYWANAAKESSAIITSDKNLQKLGGKLMETASRIDFNEACYYQGADQDCFVFNPTSWTEVKGAKGYVPTLTPSLIHFVRKEFKGYEGAIKEVTSKDLFFTTQLSRLMETGKTYFGFIDTSIPTAMIEAFSKPENSAFIDQFLAPYISVTEVIVPTLFTSLAITEPRSGSGGGYGASSKGEGEADKIKARQEAVKSMVATLYGESTPENYRKALSEQIFVIAISLELGLALPSNLSVSF